MDITVELNTNITNEISDARVVDTVDGDTWASSLPTLAEMLDGLHLTWFDARRLLLTIPDKLRGR